MEIKDLGALELDALREVSNIGAGHAATALSQLINEKVMLTVPTIEIIELEQVAYLVGSPETIVVGILMHVLGDLTGRILLVFPRDTSLLLVDLLTKRNIGTTKVLSEMERSALTETGNILAGSYLNALSDFMGMILLPSIPSMVLDMAGAVLTTTYINFGHERDNVICIETKFNFGESERTLVGYFLLIPDSESLEVILKSINIK